MLYYIIVILYNITIICHKYKYIFIENPRCASTSIYKNLSRYSDVATIMRTFKNHQTCNEVKNRVGKDIWNTYFKFALHSNDNNTN